MPLFFKVEIGRPAVERPRMPGGLGDDSTLHGWDAGARDADALRRLAQPGWLGQPISG